MQLVVEMRVDAKDAVASDGDSEGAATTGANRYSALVNEWQAGWRELGAFLSRIHSFSGRREISKHD
jgi:hypothetical protein